MFQRHAATQANIITINYMDKFVFKYYMGKKLFINSTWNIVCQAKLVDTELLVWSVTSNVQAGMGFHLFGPDRG